MPSIDNHNRPAVVPPIILRCLVAMLFCGSPACFAMDDDWLVTFDVGVAISQYSRGEVTLTTGSVEIPQDFEDKVDMANRLGMTVLHASRRAAGSSWRWVVGLDVAVDSYDVTLTDPGEQERIQGRNVSIDLLAGRSLDLTDGWGLALLAMGGVVHGTYDDAVRRDNLSSAQANGEVRGWTYGARLLSTVRVTTHFQFVGAVGYQIAYLNQYGPVIFDMGPSWPDPGTRVNAGRIEADVEAHALVCTLSLGWVW